MTLQSFKAELFKALGHPVRIQIDAALLPEWRAGLEDTLADVRAEALRLELFDESIESLALFDPLTGEIKRRVPRYTVYPGTHFVTPKDRLLGAIDQIREELRLRLAELREAGKLLEAQRLEQRTMFDMEMMKEVGYCAGIENYSRYLSGREAGEPPPCLYDYLPDDALLVVDESHQTIPQLGAMYRGDRSRKETLVEYGFRLPSALDNRPLKFEEWERLAPQMIFVSATPGDYEARHAAQVVEQVVRPTGLVDPEVEVRPVTTQVDDVLSEIQRCVAGGERVLITTLTKRMAEDLTEYLDEHGVKVRYLHADVETVERSEIIRDLRLGVFDVLVGINLLREGLDMPEVALVAIKEEAAMKKKTEEPETSMRMLDETRQMYQEILKTAPDNQKAQEGLVRVYTSMGEHHKARDIIRKNLDKNPKDARLWVEVGMTYNRQKNIDEALRCFRKATELDPENRQYVKVLGYTLVWAGRVNEGMPHLVRAIGEAPAHYNVAGILARQNHLEDARRHLQITLDLDPDFDRAKDMLTRLRETSPAGAAPSGIAPAGAADLSPTLGFTPLD